MPLIKSPSSYMGNQPNENQYLQGNPSVDPNAQTGWMNDSPNLESGWASPSSVQQGMTAKPPISTGLMGNGTALSSIVGGNTSVGSSTGVINPGGNTGITGGMGWGQQRDNYPNGYPMNGGSPIASPNPAGGQPTNNGFGRYTPEGYNPGSSSDSMKYQIGRILSQFPPGPEGLQAASGQLAAIGARVIGRDTVQLQDGTTVDVGRAFSDTTPGASRAWQYNWSGPGGGSAGVSPVQGQTSPVGSYMGQNIQPSEQQSLMNQIMFQMQQRNRGNRGFPGRGYPSGSSNINQPNIIWG